MFENRFRELIAEPQDVAFSKIKVEKTLEYFHARNDVIHCVGQDNRHYVVKFARLADSNFENEVAILQALEKYRWLKIPNVVEYGLYQNIKYVVFDYVQ